MDIERRDDRRDLRKLVGHLTADKNPHHRSKAAGKLVAPGIFAPGLLDLSKDGAKCQRCS
jgi:hypothetical protein